MVKNRSTDSTNWLVNPWFDIIFLAAFPIGLMLTAFPMLAAPSAFIKFLLYAETIINFPHMLAGFTVVYGDQKELSRKPIIFILVPLILFIAVIALSVQGYFRQIFMIRSAWGSYHLFSQNRFILGLHKSLNKDFNWIDKMLDTPAVMVSIFLSSYWIFIDKSISGLLMVFVWIVVIAFITRQVYLLLLRQGTGSSLFKTSMVASFASAVSYPALITKNAFYSIQAGIVTHDVQYLAWCWLYYRKNFYFIILFAAIGLFCIWHIRAVASSTFGTYSTAIFTSAFACVHFFLEPHAWKIAKDRVMPRLDLDLAR